MVHTGCMLRQPQKHCESQHWSGTQHVWPQWRYWQSVPGNLTDMLALRGSIDMDNKASTKHFSSKACISSSSSSPSLWPTPTLHSDEIRHQCQSHIPLLYFTFCTQYIHITLTVLRQGLRHPQTVLPHELQWARKRSTHTAISKRHMQTVCIGPTLREPSAST